MKDKVINHSDILALAIKDAITSIGEPTHARALLPVDYRNGGPDCTYPDSQSIQVTISNTCNKEEFRAYYQLAHEAVHTLSPVGIEEVTVLEEGVATMFSHRFLLENTNVNWASSGDKKYDNAWSKVKELLAIDPDALKKIYALKRSLSRLTAEEIIQAVPGTSYCLANCLASKFN